MRQPNCNSFGALQGKEDLQNVITVVGLLATIAALVVGYITYRSQRNQKRLEYAVVSKQRIVPPKISSRSGVRLDVLIDGEKVDDPSIMSVRIVNTGDRAILSSDIVNPLHLKVAGPAHIVSAAVTAVRPRDSAVTLTLDGGQVTVSPSLVNPEDLTEIQIIASGRVDEVLLGGRIADVLPVRRRSLPYPPGSGAEGEMLKFDKFMWWVLSPVLFASFAALPIVLIPMSAITRIGLILGAAILIFYVYPLRVRTLIRRRRIWKP